ncbi:MAG: YebC/PmpR family DNA-binding transcriptional regulator [Patescibacteria group bacterium]
MSGHSKWSQIKHKKALSDAQKSRHFAKLAGQIAVAARMKGSDPDSNPALRAVIEKAKEANMPADNIERAIKKGAGGGKEMLEEVLFEAYGPGGAAMLISGITDNKNRTAQEIKHILSEHGAKLAAPGSAKFLFQKTGDGWQTATLVAVDEKTKKDLMALFEALDENDGVQDVFTNADI